MKTTKVTIYFEAQKTISVYHEDDAEINDIKDKAVKTFHDLMKENDIDRAWIQDVEEEY